MTEHDLRFKLEYLSKKSLKLGLWFLIAFFSVLNGSAQETAKYRDPISNYKFGNALMDHSLYLPAKYEYERHMQQPDRPSFEKFDRLKTESILNSAIAGLRLNLPQGENELKSYIDQNYPNPIAIDAILELSSFYYNQKRYLDAVYYYDKLDINKLQGISKSEAAFKKGYSLFVQSKFKESLTAFKTSEEMDDMFYHPINYYSGMSYYFLNEYTNAVQRFEISSASPQYAPYIPYYTSQIYFSQKQYDKVISQGEKSILDQKTLNKKEIRQLLGQSYYAKNDFAKALPHLEYYEANTDKLTAEEFYQLAFTQYQAKKYQTAQKNFLAITTESGKMGQLANYYLADCYIRQGDLISARAAMKKVSQMDFDKAMAEEASFNFGKLSAELSYDREAINTLIAIPAKSNYYNESQTIINDILMNSNDYTNSLTILEGLPKMSKQLETAYQSIALKRGLQLYQEGEFAEANKHFKKAMTYPVDVLYTGQAMFWMASISSDAGNYKQSIAEFDKYFKTIPKVNDLPQESAIPMANYQQAYNFLKLKSYQSAEENFKNAIIGINSNRSKYTNDNILNRVLPDAYIRTGDCLFKQKDYGEAITYYQQAIDRRQGNFVYALYQRSILEGLQGKPYDKIKTLETITKSHMQSDYYDDALFQLGDTYQSLGATDNAIVSYQELINTRGKKSNLYNNAHLRLGLISYNAGDVNTALKYYEKVVENNPSAEERSEALLAIEEIYLNDLKQADAYLAYVEKIPGTKVKDFTRDSLNFQVAKSFYLEAEYGKAIVSLGDYITKFPKGAYKIEALYLRADCHNLQKNYQNSLADYESILAATPNAYEEKSLQKAALISYNYTQNFDKALEYYKRYEAKVSEGNEKYQAQLGALRSAFRLGQDADVKIYANKVLQNPMTAQEEKSSAYYYLGKTQLKEKDLINAKISFENVANLSNNNQSAESNYLIAEILYAQGKLKDAEDQCNLIAEKSANYPLWVAKSLILLSDIYLGKKDLINARAALEAVLENFKEDENLVATAKAKLAVVQKAEADQSRIKPKTGNKFLELQSSGGN